MTYYTKILPWENRSRLDSLNEFRALVIEYFSNSKADWRIDERIEQTKAKEIRVKINRMMNGIHDIILNAGVNPSICYTPPAVVGGYIQNIDLVQNVFTLYRFHIAHSELVDFVDQAIGIYENNSKPAFYRAINPFFYVGLAFDWVARIPFVLIERAGFSRKKTESSLVGRLIKGVIYIISVLASLLTVLQFLDYLEPIKEAVKNILCFNR